MPDKKFDLGDYVEVKDRIRLFYELFAGGRLVTGEVRLTTDPDGKPRVLVQAAAYRTADDPLPGIGWSWMELPGTSNYTRGSELENTETSAWGRAIASLGILVDRSIASAQEVANKERPEGDVIGIRDAPQKLERVDGGLIGTVEKGTSAQTDFNLRQTPTGMVCGFRLVAKGRISVQASSPLAEVLAPFLPGLEGVRVQCFGTIRDETWKPPKATKPVTYQVMALERIIGPDWTLPAPDVPNPNDGGPVLFDESDERELDAAVLP